MMNTHALLTWIAEHGNPFLPREQLLYNLPTKVVDTLQHALKFWTILRLMGERGHVRQRLLEEHDGEAHHRCTTIDQPANETVR